MKGKINIAEPCKANWDKMVPCKNGRFCGSCQKKVIDFTDKTLGEIHEYFAANNNEPICGRYQERHTAVNKRWYTILNNMEEALTKFGLRRIALLFISALLFLSGCRTSRHNVTGTETRFLFNDKKSNAEYASVSSKPQP